MVSISTISWWVFLLKKKPPCKLYKHLEIIISLFSPGKWHFQILPIFLPYSEATLFPWIPLQSTDGLLNVQLKSQTWRIWELGSLLFQAYPYLSSQMLVKTAVFTMNPSKELGNLPRLFTLPYLAMSLDHQVVSIPEPQYL